MIFATDGNFSEFPELYYYHTEMGYIRIANLLAWLAAISSNGLGFFTLYLIRKFGKTLDNNYRSAYLAIIQQTLLRKNIYRRGMFIQISFGCVFSGAGALGVPYFHFPYLVSKNFPKLVEIFAKLQAITLEGIIGTGSTLANIVLIGIGLVLLYLMVISFFYQLLFNFVAIVRIHLFKSFSFVYVNVFLILATIGIPFFIL